MPGHPKRSQHVLNAIGVAIGIAVCFFFIDLILGVIIAFASPRGGSIPPSRVVPVMVEMAFCVVVMLDILAITLWLSFKRSGQVRLRRESDVRKVSVVMVMVVLDVILAIIFIGLLFKWGRAGRDSLLDGIAVTFLITSQLVVLMASCTLGRRMWRGSMHKTIQMNRKKLAQR